MPIDIKENEEFLLLYELDPAQSLSIEPKRELFPGKLIFAAKKTDNSGSPQDKEAVLPAGKYLFTQKQGQSALLKETDWLDIAVEQQKDALWERYKIENLLYVRHLFEDGLFVIQLFRPC